MTKYFYLKLGNGNCLAEYWLNPEGKRSIYEEYEHAAAIYFGRNTVEDITECDKLYNSIEGDFKERALSEFKRKLGKSKDENSKPDLEAAINFIKAGEDPEKTRFITITQKEVFIYEPEKNLVFNMSGDKYDIYDADLEKLSKASKMRALTKSIKSMKVRIEENTEPQHIPKIMPVRFLREPIPIAEVPHVLASLPCNQYLIRGTCREIAPEKNWGAIQAVEYCLGFSIDIPNNACELVHFLSSYELETLVFLILKNAGLFVPAWRGGTQKGFDLIAYNFTNSAIKKLQLPVESEDRSKSSFTFQVKKGEVKEPSEVADWTIAIEYEGNDNRVLNAEWLLEQIRKQPDTRKWFTNLLN